MSKKARPFKEIAEHRSYDWASLASTDQVSDVIEQAIEDAVEATRFGYETTGRDRTNVGIASRMRHQKSITIASLRRMKKSLSSADMKPVGGTAEGVEAMSEADSTPELGTCSNWRSCFGSHPHRPSFDCIAWVAYIPTESAKTDGELRAEVARLREAVGFLRCCINSGESLTAEDNKRIDAALSGAPSSTPKEQK